jgi:hypothetical protein
MNNILGHGYVTDSRAEERTGFVAAQAGNSDRAASKHDSKYERGELPLTVDRLRIIARALNVPPADLLGTEDQPDGDKEAA